MHFLFEQRNIKLYETDDGDQEYSGVLNNHYAPETILLFESVESDCRIGNEIAWIDGLSEAIKLAGDIASGEKNIYLAVRADHAEKTVKDTEEQIKKAKGKPKKPRRINLIVDKIDTIVPEEDDE